MPEFISVLCPTRKRPELQKRFAQKVIENVHDSKSIEIIFGIDHDDSEALEAAKKLQDLYGQDLVRYKILSEHDNLSKFNNECYKIARGEIIGNFADDVIFHSSRWDEIVRSFFQKYEDRIALVWSDDGIWGGQLASHAFLHKNWIETLGYVSPPYFAADWSDKWNQEIAQSLGRDCVILDQNLLFFEHAHVIVGKMEADETYYRNRKRAGENRGCDLYHSEEIVEKRRQDIEKLANFIRRFYEQKVSSNSVRAH